MWKRSSRTLIFWVALITLSAILINTYNFGKQPRAEVTYTEFVEQLDADNVAKITVMDRRVEGEFKVEILVAGQASAIKKNFQINGMSVDRGQGKIINWF